ncbi:ribonuclease D [Oceanimonas sp. NS1]|nr:ribonuclease D [Oceanimonas sp. NS1]
MTYTIISDNQALADFCQTNATVLAVDTEFVRTRTYYARPGLYQINDGEHTALVDPLAVTDMSPLWRLLHDGNRLCLLHAGGEDLELFQHQSGGLPARVHDTQLAAAFLGLGAQLGFAPWWSNCSGQPRQGPCPHRLAGPAAVAGPAQLCRR